MDLAILFLILLDNWGLNNLGQAQVLGDGGGVDVEEAGVGWVRFLVRFT